MFTNTESIQQDERLKCQISPAQSLSLLKNHLETIILSLTQNTGMETILDQAMKTLTTEFFNMYKMWLRYSRKFSAKLNGLKISAFQLPRESLLKKDSSTLFKSSISMTRVSWLLGCSIRASVIYGEYIILRILASYYSCRFNVQNHESFLPYVPQHV